MAASASTPSTLHGDLPLPSPRPTTSPMSQANSSTGNHGGEELAGLGRAEAPGPPADNSASQPFYPQARPYSPKPDKLAKTLTQPLPQVCSQQSSNLQHPNDTLSPSLPTVSRVLRTTLSPGFVDPREDDNFDRTLCLGQACWLGNLIGDYLWNVTFHQAQESPALLLQYTQKSQ